LGNGALLLYDMMTIDITADKIALSIIIFSILPNNCHTFATINFDIMATTLDKQTSDKVSFITFIIPKFAKSYKMNTQYAYRYLKKYGGMDYLNECWWALHIDNPFWAVRDMYKVCRSNGGFV
jgi:hypothetical protein